MELMRRARDGVGIGAACLLALSSAFAAAGVSLGLLGLLVATAFDAPAFVRWLRRDPVAWLIVAWAVWVAFRAALPNVFPASSENRGSAIVDTLVVGAVPAAFLAWWGRRVPGRWLTLLGLAALGLVIGAALNGHWSDFGSYLHDRRMTLGLNNNGGSFFAAVLIVGLLSLAVPWLARNRAGRDRRWWTLVIVAAALGAFALMIVVLSRSRQVWLALPLLGVVTLLWQLRHRGLALFRGWSRGQWGLVVVVVLVIALVVGVSGRLIVQRMSQESATWEALASLDIERVPASSIGHRVGMWQVGLAQVAAHPWLGIGPSAARAAMRAAHNRILGNSAYPHFHDLYLQLAAEWGLPALVLFLALVLVLARGAFATLGTADAGRRDLAAFVLGSCFVFLTVSLVTVRHDDIHGGSLVTLLLACALLAGSRIAADPAADTAET